MLALMTISWTISLFVIDDNSCSPFCLHISLCLHLSPFGINGKGWPHTCIWNHWLLFTAPRVNMHYTRTCMYAWISHPFFLWVHPPSSWTQGVLRSLRDLTLGFPYGNHLPCSDQPLLSAIARSSSSILASPHMSFQHLFLHLYWLSLMSCMGNFSRVVSMYTKNIELCAQGNCNYNTSLYDNMQQCDQHGCMSNT